jgi:hypothetical protein
MFHRRRTHPDGADAVAFDDKVAGPVLRAVGVRGREYAFFDHDARAVHG